MESKYEKMLNVSKKVVYEETTRNFQILIHKSYIGIEIVFYFSLSKISKEKWISLK
jgi:hypothetical protein